MATTDTLRQTAAIPLDNINSIVQRRTGLPYATVLDVAERITAAWDFRDSDLPALQPQYLSRLLLALAGDVEPEDAASFARHMFLLTKRREPDAIVDTSAGMQLEFMLSTLFTTSNDDLIDTLTQSEIEVSSAIPPAVRVTLHAIDETIYFNEPGRADARWAGESLRQSRTITGRMLLNIVSDVRHFWGMPILEDRVVS